MSSENVLAAARALGNLIRSTREWIELMEVSQLVEKDGSLVERIELYNRNKGEIEGKEKRGQTIAAAEREVFEKLMTEMNQNSLILRFASAQKAYSALMRGIDSQITEGIEERR